MVAQNVEIISKTFQLVPGVPGFCARGGEGALAPSRRAPHGHDQTLREFYFHFFPTCRSRKSVKITTRDGTVAIWADLQLPQVGKRIKILVRLAAAASEKMKKICGKSSTCSCRKWDQ